MILCDTDVLIEHFKGNPKTIKQLHSIGVENIAISSITSMELLFGSKNKRETLQIYKALSDINILHINESISLGAVDLVSQYAKSHGLRIPDAIIAATAIFFDTKLFTYNIKDFHFIENITLLR